MDEVTQEERETVKRILDCVRPSEWEGRGLGSLLEHYEQHDEELREIIRKARRKEGM